MKKKNLLQEATLFSTSLFLSRFLLSIRGFIIPKFLGPVEYGIYNGLFIVPDFLIHFHLGSLNALKREIPFCYGKGDFSQAQKIRNIVFTQYMGTTVIAVLLLFFLTFFLKNHYSAVIIYCLWLIGLYILVQALVDAFWETLLRTDNRFDILSKAEIFKSIFGFILMLVMIWFWRLYGVIASAILSTLLKGGYIYNKTDYRLAWEWDYQELKRLIAIGFPIIVGVVLFALFRSVDQMVIIKYLNSKQLGYYALALALSKFLLIIQGGSFGILEPKVYQLFGEKEEVQALKPIVLDPMEALTLFYPFIMGLTYIGSPYLIYLFLPHYLPSLTCMHILIVGSFFYIFLEGSYSFIVAINRQNLIVWAVGVGSVCSFGLNTFLIKKDLGIEGVALGSVIVNVLVGCFFLGFILNRFFRSLKKKITVLIGFFSPFLLVVFFLVLADYFWPVSGLLKKEFGDVLMKVIGLTILNAPFLWKCKKKMAVIGLFRP